jgi:P pilus assembly chaperone PapD
MTQAAKIADGVSTVSGGGPAGTGATANITEGGDLFLIVHDDVLDTTYVQNLETEFVAFKNGGAASAKSFPLDQAGKDFLSTAGSTFQWAVFAGNNIRGNLGSPRGGITSYGNVADWGLLTTGGVTGTATGFNPGVNELSSVVNTNLSQTTIGAVNTVLDDTTNSAVFPANDPANFGPKGTTLGGAAVYNGNGSNAFLGESNTFWFLTNDYLHTVGGVPSVQRLGTFTLSTTSLEYTPASGGGTPDPVLGTITPFGDQAVGTTSTAKTVTLTNNGTAAYGITNIGTNGGASEFAVSHNCGASLAAGLSCNIDVTFTPSDVGARTGTLTVTPTSGTPLTLALSGTGVAAGTANPALGTITPFGDQTVGTPSTAKTVTLSNSGTAAYAIQSIAADGDFAATNDCNGSVAATNGSCNIQVTFTPTQAGARTGTLTVTPATGTPLTLDLSGTGIAATVDVVFGSFDPFASQVVGTTSAAKTVTLTNNGAAAYGITSIGTGTGSEFAVPTHTCGTSLAAGASCNIDITFAPTAAGARTGTLTVTPTSGAELTLALSGTGAAAGEVVLGTIDAFGSQSVGIASAAKSVSLTNNTAAAYAIQSIAASGDFSVTHDCGTSLAAGANCAIQVTFTPVLAGARSGTLTVTPATGDALTLDLSGTGVIPANLAVSPTQLDFGSVGNGKKAQLAVTLRNTGSSNLTVGSVTSPDAPFAKLKDGCSSKVLKPGKSCTVGYKFAPTGDDTFSGTSIISADGVDPVVVTLSGTTGAPGQLAVDPGPSQDIGFGGQFSLTGQEFTSVRGKVLVKGKPAKILVWTDTLIIAKAPKLRAGTYEVEVVRKGKKPSGTGQASVTVNAPQLTSLAPTSGARGSELTLTGLYFGGSKPAVFFQRATGGRKITASVGANTDTGLQVTVPKRLPVGDYQVTVSNPAGTSEPSAFAVTAN